MMEESKKWWQSKTIMVNLVAGLAIMAAQFKPDWAAFLQQYFSEAGMGWAFVNILLRVITKKEIL